MQDVTVGTKSGLDELCMIERKYRTDTQDARCRWPREDRQVKGIIFEDKDGNHSYCKRLKGTDLSEQTTSNDGVAEHSVLPTSERDRFGYARFRQLETVERFT